MDWLLIVIIAHFLYAGVFILDRYLLKREFNNVLNYAFWTSVLSIFVLLLAPFGLKFLSIGSIVFGLATGLVWFLSVVIFYKALRRGEASRIIPIIGSFVPIFTLILSFFFLEERLAVKELIAFCLLVSGGGVLSVAKKGGLIKAFPWALGAAFIAAIYFVMTKSVFLNQNFISGLIWIRLGAALSALCLLAIPFYRRAIFNKAKKVKIKVAGFFGLARILGVVASLLIYWAIFLGSVTLVNSLRGVQYAFVLLLAFLFFRKIPSLREHFESEVLWQKIFSIALIMAGLVVLVI